MAIDRRARGFYSDCHYFVIATLMDISVLAQFEKKLQRLLERFEKIQRENHELRRQLKELQADKSRLGETNQKATHQIQQMIDRLRQFDTP